MSARKRHEMLQRNNRRRESNQSRGRRDDRWANVISSNAGRVACGPCHRPCLVGGIFARHLAHAGCAHASPIRASCRARENMWPHRNEIALTPRRARVV